jgi:SET domain-containing protein
LKYENRFTDKVPPKLVIRKSTIKGAGKGLFAGEVITSGTFLGFYDGTIRRNKKRSLGNKHRNDNISFFQISKGTRYPSIGFPYLIFLDFSIDGEGGSSCCYFINHSNDKESQNAIFRYIETASERKIAAIAIRDIKNEEEILASYNQFVILASQFYSSLTLDEQKESMDLSRASSLKECP